MKKLMIGAIALGLFLAAPAAMTAQAAGPGYSERQHHATHQRASRQERSAARQHATAHRAVRQERSAYQQRAVQHRATYSARERRNVHSANRATMRANYATQRANNATHRANYATQRANRATNRADFAVYRANVRAQHRYHWNNYQRPHGWYAHHWTYGERLPATFYGSNYWITDYISFGLMAPPRTLVWVRYGDDALLINRYTGDVVRVEYDVFY